MRQKVLRALRKVDDLVCEAAGPVRILFVLSDGYGFSCQAPIMKALLKRAEAIKVATTTDRPRTVSGIPFNSNEERDLFSRHYISHGKAVFLKWHTIVNTHVNGFYPKRNALRVYMHHGPGYGILGNKVAIAEQHDIFFGLSQIQRGHFETLRPGIFGREKAFFSVGFPKADAVARDAYDRKRILSDIGLADRPTLLITSHWQVSSTLRRLEEGPFAILAERFKDFNVIQTGHPWLWSGKKIDPTWSATLSNKLERIDRRYPHARFLPNAFVEPLLTVADLLVADQSSVMTTYSLLDRPILYFDDPEVEFAIDEINELYRAASHRFEDAGDLVQAAVGALADRNEKAAGRRLMRDTFYANQGRSAEVAAELLLSIGRVCSANSPRWRRILELSSRPEHRGLLLSDLLPPNP